MEDLSSLKREIMVKRSLIDAMVLRNERVATPEIIKLSAELDMLLNKL